MNIYSPEARKHSIHNLEEWFEFCPPPKGAEQWEDNRSAKEKAKFWLEQTNYGQFRAFIRQKIIGFDYDYIVPEYESAFDSYESPRKHDLFIAGKDVSAIITVEGKVDESFGNMEFGAKFCNTINTKMTNKKSKALDRMINLYLNYFNSNGDILNIMYQLAYWFAGSIIDAIKCDTQNVVMVLQEFKPGSVKQNDLVKNHNDFVKFIQFISKGAYGAIENKQILGPIKNEYTSEKSLYIGYYSVDL
jgi:hypothetical protein